MRPADTVKEFNEKLGLTRNLSHYGINKEDFDYIISKLWVNNDEAKDLY